MNLIAKKCFPKTEIVTDRFHDFTCKSLLLRRYRKFEFV
ncbi:hypothetical protein PJW08_07825 [Tenacibaculum finnmarkense]|nr:hypothetical protein PJW08_07825 [Tenacibaculum finnmarkense]